MSSVRRIWVLTLFPEFFDPLLNCGVVGQALRGERSQKIELKTLNPRDFTPNNYKGVDDAPYGGGPGMVMRADILKNALMEGVVKAGCYDSKNYRNQLKVIYTAPRGEVWNQTTCVSFAQRMWGGEQPQDLVFICGRYEGIDERFIQNDVDEIFSLGDFVLSGGEIAVMSMLDSALRFMPGVLGNKLSSAEDSFSNGLLEHPQYTRPASYEGLEVPKVLLSGHHEKIQKYQRQKAEEMTQQKRPDLWPKYQQKVKK
jgi:tRNA (guanine37-N1)-methyltransferase